MDPKTSAALLSGLEKIQDGISKIRALVAQESPPPAGPVAGLVALENPLHISRALRGGINNFLPDHVLRLTYPINEAEAGVAVRVNYPSRVLVEFEMFFERPFDFAQGLKIFRIQSFDESTGLNNWDVILVACGAAVQTGSNPMVGLEAARNSGSWWGSAKFSFAEETWYRVAIELVKGDLDRAKSGAFRVSVDGDRILDLPGVEVIRGSGPFGDGPINRLHFGGWYSNGARGNPTPNPAAPASLRIRNAKHFGE
jgi:hypothetical protein